MTAGAGLTPVISGPANLGRRVLSGFLSRSKLALLGLERTALEIYTPGYGRA